MEGSYPQMTQMAQFMEDESPRDPETFAIIGAAMTVHTDWAMGSWKLSIRKPSLWNFPDEESPTNRKPS